MEVPSLSSESSSAHIKQDAGASNMDLLSESSNNDMKNTHVKVQLNNSSAELTKSCPVCDEKVAENAKKCKHCGEFFFNPLQSVQSTQYAYLQPQKQIAKPNEEAIFKKFFNFDYMITPGILRMFFIISVIIISISAVMYVYNVNHMANDQNLGLRILIAIFGWLSSILVVRLFFEIFILFWKIHETLKEIRDK